MKKLIAMVMTAAMVASLVPATAFAGDDIDATAKIVNSWTKKDTHKNLTVEGTNVPELQIKLTDVGSQGTNPTKEVEFTVELDNATFADADALEAGIDVTSKEAGSAGITASTTHKYTVLGDKLKKVMEDYYETLLPGKAPAIARQDLYVITDSNASNSGTDMGKINTDLTADISTKTLFTHTIASGSPYSLTAPAGTGADLDANRKTAWNAWSNEYSAGNAPSISDSTMPSSSVNGAKAGYVFKEKSDWGTGWVNMANATEPFVAESVVIAYAKTKNTTDGDATTPKSVLNTAQDAFVSTYIAPDKEKWVTAAVNTVTSALNTANSDLYVYTKKTIGGTDKTGANRVFSVDVTSIDEDEVKVKIEITDGVSFEEGDVISMDLLSTLDKTKNAYVSVDSDDINITNGDDLLYVAIEDEGVTASIKKVATVAEEESTTLEKNLVIKSTVENFAKDQIIELKLSNGFEFTKACASSNANYSLTRTDEDVLELKVLKAGLDKIEVAADDIEIEATSAKAGATATMTVKATNNVTGAFNAKTTVEVMKVVEYTVVLSVDEDEDVPVIYSGVDVKNTGITDDADHWTVRITAEETFPGAWSFRKGFDLDLPEGVYVTDVDVKFVEGFLKTTTTADKGATDVKISDMEQAFFDAYQKGDHVSFEFDKRVFDDVDAKFSDTKAKVEFELQLVADPTFTGDVNLKLSGDLVDEQEVTIAKFVAPFTVKAEQNDLIIDYRYTEIPTEIVVTETEAGLWDKDKAEFGFTVEKPDYIVFEDDPTFTVDKESGMELDDAKLKKFDGNTYEGIYFVVDKESDEAASVTISDMSLFMERSIPAGAYDLEAWTSMWDAYENQQLFAADCMKDAKDTSVHSCTVKDNECIVDDVCDYSKTVKEAFVNVVTAGRDQDDASFTTKVVVPVGENKITAGEVEYTIDAPAYINANGYTMLPVRAVATALGIKNDNVLWDQATKTVTILYGQRIITMQVGASVVYVNGAAIPASSSVEITNSRTFLGLRDLATALGVTDITWDASTKTATLNGGNTAE